MVEDTTGKGAVVPGTDGLIRDGSSGTLASGLVGSACLVVDGGAERRGHQARNSHDGER